MNEALLLLTRKLGMQLWYKDKPMQKRVVRLPMLTVVICINALSLWLVHEVPCCVGRSS